MGLRSELEDKIELVERLKAGATPAKTPQEKRRDTIEKMKAEGTWHPKPRRKKSSIEETSTISTILGSVIASKTKKPALSGGYYTLDGYFKVKEGTYNILEANLRNATQTLLLGPTGTGKTELIAAIAKQMGLDLTIFDMGTMIDPIMGLVGSHIIHARDGVTTSIFVKSRFAEALSKPGIILLDELNRANVMANNLLLPCLDFRKELAMEYNFEDPNPIAVHPECIILATANIGAQYVGTSKIDPAVLSRFMLIDIEALDEASTRDVLKAEYPKLSVETVKSIVSVYFEINKAHEEFTISFSLSPRHLKRIAQLVVDGFTIYDTYYITCKGIGGKEGLKALESILLKIK